MPILEEVVVEEVQVVLVVLKVLVRANQGFDGGTKSGPNFHAAGGGGAGAVGVDGSSNTGNGGAWFSIINYRFFSYKSWWWRWWTTYTK
jgi:hypothetical protein